MARFIQPLSSDDFNLAFEALLEIRDNLRDGPRAKLVSGEELWASDVDLVQLGLRCQIAKEADLRKAQRIQRLLGKIAA